MQRSALCGGRATDLRAHRRRRAALAAAVHQPLSRPHLRDGAARPDADRFPGGQRRSLLAAVEGSAPRIVHVDPRDGGDATELDLADFLQQRSGMPVSYVIAAYNDMA